MAFYKSAPDKHKPHTNYAEKGSWDEEGTHYSDRKGQTFADSEKKEAMRSFNSKHAKGSVSERRTSSFSLSNALSQVSAVTCENTLLLGAMLAKKESAVQRFLIHRKVSL